MLNVGKKMWPISALLVELVGVAGFEPATAHPNPANRLVLLPVVFPTSRLSIPFRKSTCTGMVASISR
jgi:hypothetical protein